MTEAEKVAASLTKAGPGTSGNGPGKRTVGLVDHHHQRSHSHLTDLILHTLRNGGPDNGE